MFKPGFIETDLTLDHKVAFLNSVFLFAGIVAFGMGFFRWQSSAVMGSIDFVFSLCSFALVYFLNNHKERIATISSIALVLSYCLFTAIYLLAPYNTSRISLFFLLSASAFFLKGRQAGLAWLILILLTIVVVHFLPGFDTAYSHIDIVTTSLYLLALFFIFLNYEKFKEQINERDRDKEVLRLSEERFRAMVENGNDIISIISNTGMVRFISPSVEPVLGFEPGEMINKNVNDLIHPEDQPKAATALANMQAHPGGETLERYEFRMKHKDGSYRDIEMVVRNLISNPVIGGIVLNGRDITGRKQLEQQLSRRLHHRDVMERITQISLNSTSIEELLGRVLDEMQAIFNADRAWFLYPCDPDAPSWSVPMERTRPEWPGAFARGMVIPMTPEIAEVFREVLASTKPLPYGPAASRFIPAAVAEQFSIRSQIQMALRPKVGSPWTMGLHHCAQARAYDEDDLLIFNDIGQRVADVLNSMLILKSLRESEERYRLLVEFSPFCVHEIDLEGRFQSMNSAGLDMLGLDDAEKIRGVPYLDTVNRQDAGRIGALLREAINNGMTSHFEFVATGDAPLYFKSCFVPIRDAGGKVLKLMGITEDITERKKAELAFRRYKLVIDTVNDGFWITDTKGNMLEANTAYARMSGYSVGELTNMHISQLEAIERSENEVVTHIERIIAQGYERFETRHRRKDGHEIDVEVSATFMSELQQFFVFIHDITERKQIEDALRASEASQSAILNNSPYLVWLKDPEGCYLKVNKAYADYVRLEDAQQIIGKIDFDLWPEELAEKYRADDVEVMASRQQKHVEEPSLDGDVMHWVETFKTPVIDENGNVLGTTGFARDITERKQMEQNLRDSEARFRAVAQTANDAIITANAVGNIVDCNAAAELFFGYTKAEINGQPLTVLMPERFRNLHNEGLARMTAGGAPRIMGKSVEVAGLRKDGSEFPLELSLAQWQTADGQFFTAIIRDITERKQAEEQIHTLAFYDALTQLPNRRLLNDRLEQTMAASKRSAHYGALMFLDLDNFKPLNDTHGHVVGDLLLIEVAHRLTSCVREVDTVARFGGDEFVVLLGELDADQTESTAQAGIIAEKIRSTLAKPYLLKIQQEGKAETTVEHRCAASIGVVVFNSEAGMKDILKWADAAMYQAKEGGRNLICFHK